MSKFIPFPAWLPDQLELGNVLVEARNVLPFQTGYAPVGDFAAISDAMPQAFNGGGSFISTTGTAYLLAGGSTALYRMSGGAWTAVQTGLTPASRFRFVQFGNIAFGVNGGATFGVNLATGAYAAVAGAPTGLDVAVAGRHIMVAQPNGAQLDVAWSALNDYTGWTPGVNQAGQETMTTGGEVMGVAGGEYGLVLQRERIVRADVTGDADAPFAFNEITNNYGCASTASIVQAGRSVFCLSDRGFIAIEDGQTVKPIGNEKFDRWFRDIVPRSDWERLYAAVDPRRTLVMWAMPGAPGFILIYNWALDRATSVHLSFEALFSGYEAGVTLEGLDALYPSGLDSMTYSLDDPRFDGGSPALYVVKDSKIGLLSGSPLEARLKQGQYGGTFRQRLRAVWPEIDATSGVMVGVEARQRMGDAVDAITSGSMQSSGRVPLRAAGRYFTPTFTVAAGTDWGIFTGYRLEETQAGVRT